MLRLDRRNIVQSY